MKKHWSALVLMLFLGLFVFIRASFAQPVGANSSRAVILSISGDTITVHGVSGILNGKTVQAKLNPSVGGQTMHLQKNDNVMVDYFKNPDGRETIYVADFVRTPTLYLLFIAFLVMVVVVGRWKGVRSLIGMMISFFFIIQFIIPQMLAGSDPVVVSLLGSIIIVPITFYIAHGFNKKTTIAVVGTFIALVLTAVLAHVFISLAKLTGFSSDEAAYIQQMKNGAINIRSLLLAGIIIGALGILNDITIAQTAVVEKIAEVNIRYHWRELYTHGMEVGREHIASLVNTLILVYVGAALPLFLLFYNTDTPFTSALNTESIATEVIRTLVGSIGIIAAVPITTFLAAVFARKLSR